MAFNLIAVSVSSLLLVVAAYGVEQFGLFEYEIVGDEVTITGYSLTEGPSSVAVPTSIEGLPVTRIADLAFNNRSQITSIVIPEGVREIGEAVFAHSSLEQVSIADSVESIGEGSFSWCSGLTALDLPDSLTEISPRLCALSQNLISVEIPAGITHIYEQAFRSCNKLTSYILPSTLEFIGDYAFDWTSNKTLNIPASVTYIGRNGFWGTSVEQLTLNSSDTELGRRAFGASNQLTSVSIPSKIIGEEAFYSCLYLEEITLGSEVEHIGFGALGGSYGVSSIYIPASVLTIDSAPAYRSWGLREFLVSPDNPNYQSVDGVLLDKGGSVLIQYPCKLSGHYAIPTGVQLLADRAFYSSSLSSVQMPSSLTVIGDAVFANSRLTNAHIPHSVISIGERVFANNYFTSITVDPGNQNYSSLDDVLFDKTFSELITYPSEKSGSYSIPSGVQHIAPWAFASCNDLTAVTMPSSVTEIGAYAFYFAEPLESIAFIGDAPSVGIYAFDDIPGGVSFYFDNSSTGFSEPQWEGNPASGVDTVAYPHWVWLHENTLSPFSHMLSDFNGDGIPLLLSYALGFDPNNDLSGAMPSPLIEGDSLSFEFRQLRDDINYTVLSSEGLESWNDDAVMLSIPNENGVVTASVPMNKPAQFMKLEVSEKE
jgi:hypothetical protein